MAGYGNLNTNKKRKSRKIFISIAAAVAVVLAGIYIIGIIAGMNDEQGQEVSSAVSENVRLRQEVSEKDDEIARLTDEINTLHARINELPAPSPMVTDEPSPSPNVSDYYDEDELLSPRSGNVR